MKNFKIILLGLICGSFLVSCEDDDNKFTGSPVGVMPLETITATVSTTTMFALPGQEIDFTATLPADFRSVVKDTVTVQATIVNASGGLRNASVDILPGSNTGTEKIIVPGGGGTFDLNFDLKLTGINLKKVVPGKHYLLKSNVINIASGNSAVPTTNDQRLKVFVDWENTNVPNKLRVKIERVKLTTITLKGTELYTKIRVGSTDYISFFNSSLETTASDFVTQYKTAILANSNITVSAVGSDLHFAYLTDAIPAISVVAYTAPITAATAVSGTFTYTSNNDFRVGDRVRVTGYAGANSSFNSPAAGLLVTAATPTSFTVNNPNSSFSGSNAVNATVALFPTNGTLKGDIYAEVNVGAPADRPKAYSFATSKLGTTSEGVATTASSSSYAYTPGNYRIKIGVTAPTDLEVSPTNLKYRITLRFPDGNVKIYNGIYDNLSVASGFKTVMLITKNGVGDSTTYAEPVFTP